ncbi:MAG: YbaK/EbsC family protein [Syntrophomonadaceae bacterium]
MGIEQVREYFKIYGRDDDIMEFDISSATVELASQALGIEPARIAKTLSFRDDGGAMLVVTAGDAKVDSSKFKSVFGFKARMLKPEEVMKYTGYAVGGVCPFGLTGDVPVYLDVSLQRFESVYPACGSDNSAIKLSLPELEIFSASRRWIDVCKNWQD